MPEAATLDHPLSAIDEGMIVFYTDPDGTVSRQMVRWRPMRDRHGKWIIWLRNLSGPVDLDRCVRPSAGVGR